MINYCICKVTNQTTGKDVYYARSQYNEVMSTEDFCRHIANHGTSFSRATIQAVVTEVVDCLRELLLDGKKVRLGSLGDFWMSLSSETTSSPDLFTASNIQSCNPRWARSSEFDDMRSEATFQLVPKRADQALAIEAVKENKSITVVGD